MRGKTKRPTIITADTHLRFDPDDWTYVFSVDENGDLMWATGHLDAFNDAAEITQMVLRKNAFLQRLKDEFWARKDFERGACE